MFSSVLYLFVSHKFVDVGSFLLILVFICSYSCSLFVLGYCGLSWSISVCVCLFRFHSCLCLFMLSVVV